MVNTSAVTAAAVLIVLQSAAASPIADGSRENYGSYQTKGTHYVSETEGTFWLTKATEELLKHTERRLNMAKARNLILFVGDGMSVATVSASRILMGQLAGNSGEGGKLAFEDFPYTGLAKTYCVDKQVADSACSATAYLSGVKTNQGTLGVTAKVSRGDCEAMLDSSSHVSSILAWAANAGKYTGIVTTTRVTHATPAGSYAHTASRDWESDKDVLHDKQDPSRCPDIATQLVHHTPGKDIKVILGGGRREFLAKGREGRRKDGKDLIKAWLLQRNAKGAVARYVSRRQELLGVDFNSTAYLLGLFSTSHMPYASTAETETPSLAEMTEAAIRLLSNGPHGYFLLIEGGRIDHAHHDTQTRRALLETLELSKAVSLAAKVTAEADTLIVVTADHGHTMTFSGYPERGADILGLAGVSDVDKLPFATLSYANGPHGERHDLTMDDMGADEYHFPANVPRHQETHGGDDVAVFARGPWAHLLTGAYEQNYIPIAMAFAACLGNSTTLCSSTHL